MTVALACGKLGPDLSPVIAIATVVPDSLEEDDRLVPQAMALDGAGNVVPGVTISWMSLDTVLGVILPDTVVVRKPGLAGRLQAAVGTLLSNPLTIQTFVAADTLFSIGRKADTVSLAATPDSLSHVFTVMVADTVVTGSGPDSFVPLRSRPVVFTLVHQTAGDSVTLIATDTTAHVRVAADTIASDSSGLATVRVRFLGGPLPDTALVTASTTRARGAPAPGSPDTLVVTFRP
ncbi:MAG TPA: hypothetical protein VH116_11150 [Gemmatimonadales bacterium]|nr:hypothetical protein [Gemmatimonadales bacterium]